MSTDYFQHFGLPKKFLIDPSELKKAYYRKSMDLHPDFHTLSEQDHQEEMLAQSAYNNKAYQTLKDFSKRTYYLLSVEGMISEEGENKLPQSFLMEMMEVNEKIMELEFDYDERIHSEISDEVAQLEEAEFNLIKPLMQAYDKGSLDQSGLTKIRDFYFKQKYLWRIKENLDKFADRR